MAVTTSRERYAAPAPPAGRELSRLFISARPEQWVKNLVVPLPFLFGGALGSAHGWRFAALGFAVFCAVTSAVYLVNDVMDRERDRAHPVKRRRPLASGELRVSTALVAAGVLGLAANAAAWLLQVRFGVWSMFYTVLMIVYSLWLKKVPFVEALIVASGMPLRALAGAALADVPPSTFLLVCAYLLALFLVVGKRQWELQKAGRVASSEHRSVLASYRSEELDFLFVVTALATVAAYGAYSVAPHTLAFHGHSFAPTVPLVVLGVARYVRLVYRRGGGGSPTRALLIDDPWLLLIVVGWVVTAGWIIYGH
ncbi:MAG TPA: UbiA prenyltransferase family protein [Thermoanaerobaculia bacterium]|nr:UbiA prenyltransferase family protein [Thermoanaerobaculia bacterium]